ncbi:MAG: SIS domain-containing protein [Deinococcales bacterium]
MSMDRASQELEMGAALRREIGGQQELVARTLRDPSLAWQLDALAADVRASGELLVTGMGSSLHAGMIVTQLLRRNGVRAWALPASELLHYGEAVPVRPLLLVSQSGASVEIERLLARGREGVHALTLDPASPLGRFGAAVIPGGPERAYAATRSFTTTVAALYALASRLGVGVELEELAPSIEPALGELTQLDAARARLQRADAVFVTGRGPLHGLAEYVALVLMELTRVPCAALESAQFRHGPLEAAGERLAVLALTARGSTGGLVRRFASEVGGAGSPTVLLDAGGEPSDGGGLVTVGLPGADEAGAVLPLAVVAQRLAVALAEARGIRPGVPLRSEKVTREE